MPFASPFPPLHLSSQEETSLKDTLATLVQDAGNDFDQLATSQRWKLIKSEARADLKIFSDTTAGPDQFRFLTTATVPGKIEDAVFSNYATTTHQVFIRSAYRSDGLQDCAVLATLTAPTENDPMHSTSLHWTLHSLPMALDKVIKNPEATVLDATGFTTTPAGTRVGYYVEHSVDLPELPPLKDYNRMQHTAIVLFRQRDNDHFDVYFQMTLAMKYQLVGTLLARYVGKKMIHGQDMTYVSYMNKLAWLLQHPDADRHCDVAGGNKECCALCCKAFDRHQLHDEKLFAIVADDKLVEFIKPLCEACRLRVQATSALEIAKAEVPSNTAQASKLTTTLAPSEPSSTTIGLMSPNNGSAHSPTLESWRELTW